MESDKKFKIQKWNAIAMWNWNIEVYYCPICRQQINDPCINCESNQQSAESEECRVVIGVCYHAFHFHCISRFLTIRQACPLDDKVWEFLKFSN